MKASTERATAKFNAAKKLNEGKNIENAIARAIILKAEIDNAKAELDLIKASFAELLESDGEQNKLITRAGTVILETTTDYEIDPLAADQLKSIFKKYYLTNYLSEKTTYTPTSALIELLSDADFEHKNIIRNACLIKTTKTVNFMGIAKPEEGKNLIKLQSPSKKLAKTASAPKDKKEVK